MVGSRPPSRTSQLSGGQWSATAAPPPPPSDRDQETATAATGMSASGEDDLKQSILTKAQAVQEQVMDDFSPFY